MSGDAPSCTYCRGELAANEGLLRLPCCRTGEPQHAMHAACAWRALTPTLEIMCACGARCSPAECVVVTPRGRGGASVETVVAGGASAAHAAQTAFSRAAVGLAAAGAGHPGNHILITTHYVGADRQVQEGVGGVLIRGRGNRRLLHALGRLLHDFCFRPDAMAARAREPPAYTTAELRELARAETSGTFRLVYALVSGSPEWKPEDAVPGSPQWTLLAPAYFCWQHILKMCGPRGMRTTGADYMSLQVASHRAIPNGFKDLLAEMRLANARRTNLAGQLKAATRDTDVDELGAFIASLEKLGFTDADRSKAELICAFDNYGQRMTKGYDQWVMTMLMAISPSEQRKLKLDSADDTPKDFDSVFQSSNAIVAETSAQTSDFFTLANYVHREFERALELCFGDKLLPLEAAGETSLAKGYMDQDARFMVELEDTIMVRDALAAAANDAVEEGEGLMVADAAVEEGEESSAFAAARRDGEGEEDVPAEGEEGEEMGEGAGEAADEAGAERAEGKAAVTFFDQQHGTFYPLPGAHADLNKTETVRSIAYAAVEAKRRMEATVEGGEPEQAGGNVYMADDGAPNNLGIRICRREPEDVGKARFLQSGAWHARNAFRQHVAQLYFESFESAIVKQWRPFLGQQMWYAFATNPNQFNKERRLALSGFYVGWVEVAVSALRARGVTSVNAVDIHEFTLERAAECPVALLALKWSRYAAVYQMSLDSIRRTDAQPYGDFAVYKAFCRIMTGYIFPVTNAHKYMYIMIYQLTQWAIISEREYLLVANALFTGRTPNGENCEVDIIVENVIGYVTTILGKSTPRAGSVRTRDMMGKTKELAEARLAGRPRISEDEFKVKQPRAGLFTAQFQSARRFVHNSRLAVVGSDLTLAKGKGKAKLIDRHKLVNTLDHQMLNPLLLCHEDIGLDRLRARALLELPHSSYCKPDRPGETTAYLSIDTHLHELDERRAFERLRATTDDLSTISDRKFRGGKGESLFTKSLLKEAIKAARNATGDGMTDAQLGAAGRPALCSELCRLRKRHPQLVVDANALFNSGEGYDTELPTLRDGGDRGPIVKFKNKEYAPLESDVVQLRALRTLASKSYPIAGAVGTSAAGSAAAAAGSAGASSGSAGAGSSDVDPRRARLRAARAIAASDADPAAAARTAREAALAAAFEAQGRHEWAAERPV